MARQRNPNRDKAKEMWLKSGGNMKLKDIAAELGVAENAVRKWKSEDKWEKERSDKTKRNAPKKKNTPKKPQGAPIGNKNAVGNAGGGAPLGNTNALKHGGYSSIFWDTLSEREKEMIDTMDQTVEQQLIEEIKLLTVREHRILHNLQKYRNLLDRGEHLVKSGTSRKEVLRDFDTEEDREKFAELARKAEERGDKLPGNEYELTTKREATIDLIHRLEDALTRCQNEKRRCLDSLHKVQSQSKGSGQELKSNNLIDALFEHTKEDIDISDIPELIEAAEADDDLVESSAI